MITVKRKDAREANENLLRRFNRRVLQSGVIAKAKAEKAMQIRLGLLKSSR